MSCMHTQPWRIISSGVGKGGRKVGRREKTFEKEHEGEAGRLLSLFLHIGNELAYMHAEYPVLPISNAWARREN